MLSMPRIVRPDPPLDRPLADPLSETKNWRNLLTGRRGSQVSHSLPAHLERFIGDEAVTDCRRLIGSRGGLPHLTFALR